MQKAVSDPKPLNGPLNIYVYEVKTTERTKWLLFYQSVRVRLSSLCALCSPPCCNCTAFFLFSQPESESPAADADPAQPPQPFAKGLKRKKKGKEKKEDACRRRR